MYCEVQLTQWMYESGSNSNLLPWANTSRDGQRIREYREAVLGDYDSNALVLHFLIC